MDKQARLEAIRNAARKVLPPVERDPLEMAGEQAGEMVDGN